MSKSIARVLISILSISLLFSQSLVEISKKEQERREKLKGENVKVVTNADLQSVGRKPAAVTGTAESDKEGAPGQAAPIQPAEPEPAGYPEGRRLTGGEPNSYVFASSVLADTYLVENPEFALNSPDGRYAEMSMLGLLDLEFSARNGPGDDVAVYSRLAGLQELMSEAEKDGTATDAVAYQWWEGFWYGVLAMGDKGDWEVIGQGTGRSSPEKFDLGRFQSIKKIRIIFKPHNNPDLPAKIFRNHPAEFTFGIDAVEAIHR
jgi:hypothetical protein